MVIINLRIINLDSQKYSSRGRFIGDKLCKHEVEHRFWIRWLKISTNAKDIAYFFHIKLNVFVWALVGQLSKLYS